MPYLQRLNTRPSTDDLTPAEAKFLDKHFQTDGVEALIMNVPLLWEQVETLEIVPAPSVSGLMGTLVRAFTGTDRYHVGIYFSRHYETVLPNVSRNLARHIAQEVAHHAPNPVRYEGVEGLVALTE
jgi:hypothetical protein